MSDDITKSGGGFFGGVGQNIVANICATILGAACVQLGITRGNFENLSNWPIWVALVGGLVVLGFGINTARLTAGRVRARWRVRAASGGKLAVLIAKLQDDSPGDPVRESLREALKRELGAGVEIVVWPEALVLAEGHDADAQQQAIRTARHWLKQKKCDLLLWGRVKSSKVVSLRATGVEMDTGNPTSYLLTETLDLPMKFMSDLGPAIAAHVTALAGPAIEQRGRYLALVVRKVADHLEPLARKPNPSFDSDTRGAIIHAYALVRHTLGEQSGPNEDLEAAIAAYRDALTEHTRDRTPLQWAATQNGLGNALRTLGERERSTARLEEAVAAFGAALEERTRKSVPLQWAATQSDLGSALARLGEHERSTARLEEAVAAFHAALGEWTRERAPLDWAGTQNNLGNALRTLGEHERGTARLEEAVAAFRAALKEWTRERVPYWWAMTQNNLGLALWRLGERERGTARLEEAVAAFRAALKEWKRERGRLQWADMQNYLGIALATLSARESGTARLKEAVVAFRAALEERPREREPFLWALTQENLATALLALGERTTDRGKLLEALAAVDGALEVHREAEATGYREKVENLRANILTALGGRS